MFTKPLLSHPNHWLLTPPLWLESRPWSSFIPKAGEQDSAAGKDHTQAVCVLQPLAYLNIPLISGHRNYWFIRPFIHLASIR